MTYLNRVTQVKNLLPTKIGNNVSIGSNATILPIGICDGVVIGAGSVVTKILKQKEYMQVILPNLFVNYKQ